MTAAGGKPGDALSTYAAFIRRDLITALSYRLPFVLDLAASFIQVTIFYFLGEIVDRDAFDGSVGTASGYFSFVAIGLAVTRIVDTALRSFSSKLRSEQMTGTFEALVASPAPLMTLVLGSAVYDLLYGLLSGTAVIMLAVGFGLQFNASIVSLGGGLLGLGASLTFFAAVGVALAAFIVVYKQGQSVMTMVTAVLGLLGGAFFPVSVFPEPMQLLAQVNPLKWSLDVLRAAAFDRQILWGELVALVACAAALMPCALYLLRVAVNKARRDGTLAQY